MCSEASQLLLISFNKSHVFFIYLTTLCLVDSVALFLNYSFGIQSFLIVHSIFPELKILETAFIFISGDLLGLFHIHDSFTSVLY